ncbi:MAG: hypothetical protein AUJ57_06465 [Zetaproteobacteria bacterium CG1_02_53_45]|nr:MAG: hypothetical protein AUJ57_06465 [Zetaproteobacteria bacterium CG1_02_53_45]
MATGLKGAMERLKNVAGDLASLEVQTYTGTVSVQTDGQGKLVDFEKYLEAVQTQGNGLKLVAVTKMNFDGDAINLVPEDAFPEHIQNAHDSAIRAGIETRQGLLQLFGDIIGLK